MESEPSTTPLGPLPSEPEWHRLHPVSLLVNLIPQAWRLLRGYWPLLLALFIGSEAGIGGMDLVFLLFFFGLTALRTGVHWATLRYRVRDERLEIRTGLLNRQVRLIGPERIQNAERVQNPLHRVAGLVEVRLETAGDASTEGLLSALSVEAADTLLAELDRLRRATRSPGRDAQPPAGANERETLLELGFVELLAHGLSARRVGVLAVVLVVVMELSQQIGPGETQYWAGNMHLPFLVGVGLAAFVAGWALAIVNSFLRLHRFRLSRQRDRMIVEQGLLTRRRIELPRGRIQLLRVDEPLLRRLMGYATVHVETAAISVGQDGVRQAEATLPMVAQDQLVQVCHWLLPELEAIPKTRELRPVPLRALWWSQMNALRTSLFLTALAVVFAGWWGALALALWFPLALTALLDWRWQAWLLTGDMVVARRGFWNRQTWILPSNKVQSTSRHQGPVMRLYGLGLVMVKMAGSRVPLPPLLWPDAARILQQVRWRAHERPLAPRLDTRPLASYPVHAPPSGA